MIGIYYFKNGDQLRYELQYLIDNNIIKGGEYQLPDALKNLTQKGVKFKPGKVIEWLDCGNKEVTVHTNQRVLEFDKNEKLVAPDVKLINAMIVPPCYVGKGVVLENTVIGPHVSVGEGTKISNSVIVNSIIQKNSLIKNSVLQNSMIGSHVGLHGKASDVSLGDYTTLD
jgi:glucose-1-phosphate thymidylyltransferase